MREYTLREPHYPVGGYYIQLSGEEQVETVSPDCRMKAEIADFYVDCYTSPTMAEVVRRHPKVTAAKKRFRCLRTL
ncbi:hypothetical protein J6590_036960 [Homalodisca vitripennis]|nr:hypothetical protein J6590_036960 [Homalodisca vitripennis]